MLLAGFGDLSVILSVICAGIDCLFLQAAGYGRLIAIRDAGDLIHHRRFVVADKVRPRAEHVQRTDGGVAGDLQPVKRAPISDTGFLFAPDYRIAGLGS